MKLWLVITWRQNGPQSVSDIHSSSNSVVTSDQLRPELRWWKETQRQHTKPQPPVIPSPRGGKQCSSQSAMKTPPVLGV